LTDSVDDVARRAAAKKLAEQNNSESFLDVDTSSHLLDEVDETTGEAAETERRHRRMLMVGQAILGGTLWGLGLMFEGLGRYAPKLKTSGRKHLDAAKKTRAESS